MGNIKICGGAFDTQLPLERRYQAEGLRAKRKSALSQCSALRCVTICPVSPGVVGALVNVIAVGIFCLRLHSAPFAMQKDTSKAAIFKVVEFDHFKTFFSNREPKSKLFVDLGKDFLYE